MDRGLKLEETSEAPITCKGTRKPRVFPEFKAKRLTCGKCGLEKKANEFPPVKVDRMAYCDACRGVAQEKAKQVRAAARRARIREFRAQVVEAFGGKCECSGCEVTEPDFMTIEHAFDRNDRKVYSALEAGTKPSHLWELLVKKRFPRDRYRMLCQNCRMARQQEGACPCEDFDVR